MSQRHRADSAGLPPKEELRAHARSERHRVNSELHTLSSSVGHGIELDDAEAPPIGWKPVHHRDGQRARTKAAKAKRPRHWKLKAWKRRSTLRRQRAIEARQLVNDLDLTVVGPGGVTYYGNAAATGDRINNVEGVVIDRPPVGRYSVRVRAHNVPVASQPYALSVGGPIAAVGQLTVRKTAEPATLISPPVGASRPTIMGIAVVFPAPLRQTLPSVRPRATLSDRLATALV